MSHPLYQKFKDLTSPLLSFLPEEFLGAIGLFLTLTAQVVLGFTLPLCKQSTDLLELFSNSYNIASVIVFVAMFYGALCQIHNAELISDRKELIEKIAKQTDDIAELTMVKETSDLKCKAQAEEIIELRGSYYRMAERWLRGYTEETLGLNGDEIRASLYRFDKKTQVFFRIGRWSGNNTYASPGRTSFSPNRGILAKAFSQSEFYDDDLPEDKAAWIAYQNSDLEMKPKEARELRMQSLNYAGFVIFDGAKDKIAVLLLESTRAGVFTRSTLSATIEEYRAKLSIWMEAHKQFEPNYSFASENGF